VLLQMRVARAIAAGLAADQEPHQAAADAALLLLGNVCSSVTQLGALQGTGEARPVRTTRWLLERPLPTAECGAWTSAVLGRGSADAGCCWGHLLCAGVLRLATQVLLGCPAESRRSLWALLALCAACRHSGCAQELLGLGFGGLLAGLVAPGSGGIRSRGLAAAALAQLAGDAQLAGELLCGGDVVQRLALQVASITAELAGSRVPAAAAAAAAAQAAGTGAARQEGNMALQLCGVLSDLAALPGGRAQLAAAAPLLVQVLAVAALPGQQQELLLQLGRKAGALLSTLLRSPDSGPALLQQQQLRLPSMLLQLPCSEAMAGVHGAALDSLAAAVQRDPGFLGQLRWAFPPPPQAPCPAAGPAQKRPAGDGWLGGSSC
jgi:hypothetical protein